MIQRVIVAITLSLLALLRLSPAEAAWSRTPVVVREPEASIVSPLATPDGAGGAFVVWREDSLAGGPCRVRAQHLLGSGDLDPGWPAEGLLVCRAPVNRALVRALDDHAGGFFIGWMESSALFVHHVLGSGKPDARWPANGLRLASVTWEPAIIEDGLGGLFAAWSEASWRIANAHRIHLARIQPDGKISPAWNAERAEYPLAGWEHSAFKPSIARTGDGGLYLTFVRFLFVPEDVESSTESCCALRLTSTGVPAPDWPADGIEMAVRHLPMDEPSDNAFVRASEDGAGGLYCLAAPLRQLSANADTAVLYRFDRLGVAPSGWPAEGVKLDADRLTRDPVMIPDGRGGAVIGSVVGVYTDTDDQFLLQRIGANGQERVPDVVRGDTAPSLVPDPLGGFHAASTHPVTWSNWIAGGRAGLSVHSFVPGDGSGSEFEELGQPTPWVIQYGEASVAPTGDGGCIVFYVHGVAPAGLVAIRLDASSRPLDAPAPLPPSHVRLARAEWIDGLGVRVTGALPAGPDATIELFDLAGRRIARVDHLPSAASLTVVLPGTDGLAPGIYFARLLQRADWAAARVAVLR